MAVKDARLLPELELTVAGDIPLGIACTFQRIGRGSGSSDCRLTEVSCADASAGTLLSPPVIAVVVGTWSVSVAFYGTLWRL